MTDFIYLLDHNVSSSLVSSPDFSEDISRMEATLILLQRNLDDFYLVTFTLITFVIGCISFWLFGFAFSWSEGNAVIGWHHFAFADLPRETYSLALRQLIFANSASTRVNGALAERLNLPSYFLHAVLLTGVAYPMISRWGWYSSGWLKTMGYRDFGGSGIVHLFSGVCAVVAAQMIGPRDGRFIQRKKQNNLERQTHDIPGHSLPLVGLGALLVTLGHMGFNASSQLSISQVGDGAVITNAAFTTLLGASAGGLTALLIHRFVPYWSNHWSYITMANGALAGMAAVCAGCDSLAPWAAFVTGIFGATAFLLAKVLLHKLEVDDPMDAFPVHFGGGLVGVVTAPFLIPDGIFTRRDNASASILGCNLLGAVVIILWAVTWCLPIFGWLNRLQLLRVPLLEENTGIDVNQHRELSYPVSSWDDFCHSLFEEQSVRDWLPPLSNSMANPPLFANMTHSRKRGVLYFDAAAPRSMNEPSLLSISTVNFGELNSSLSEGSTLSLNKNEVHKSTRL